MKALRLSYYLALIAAAIALALYYVAQEDNIYYWDFNGYWHAWQELTAAINADIWQGLQDLQHSIYHADYNTAPVFPLYPFSLLPLPSRSAYILALVITYLLPVCLLFACLVRRFTAHKTAMPLFAFTLAITFTPFWSPVLRGYPDICGLIPILLVLLYSMKHDSSGKFRFRDALAIGFLLWLPFLLRRWYAYTVVTLYATLPLFHYYWHKNARSPQARLLAVGTHFMAAGIISIILVCLTQGGLVQRVINTDYGHLYSAYYSPISFNLAFFLHRIGYYFLPLPLLGIIAVFAARTRENRIFTAFCLANLCLSFLLFSRSQSPDMHHTLPFALWILCLAVMGVIHVRDIWAAPAFPRYVLPALLALNTAALYSALFIGNTPLSPYSAMPLHLQNKAEFQRLLDTVDRLAGKDKTFAFLASSAVINDEIFRTFSHNRFGSRQLNKPDVDLRDRFNAAMLKADFLIVADPVQLHLGGHGQEVIKVPANALLKRENIGEAFERLPETFILGNNIKAYIYVRKHPYNKAQLQAFFNTFYALYPEWRQYYDTPLLYAYALADIQPGDVWGAFAADNDGIIFAHPGENTPTRVHWTLEGIDRLHFTSTSTACNAADPILITLSSATSAPQTYALAKGATVSVDTKALNGIPSTLEIARNQSSACDALTISTDTPQS